MTEDECHHDMTHEYLLEQSKSTECDDLCDIDHLFHFIAIIDMPNIILEASHKKDNLTYKYSHYIPPFQKMSIKPPIA